MAGSKTFVLDHLKRTGLQEATILQSKAPDMNGTQILAEEQYIPTFDPSVQYREWKYNTVVQDADGNVWKLIQPYDSITYPDEPKTESMRTFWGAVHTKDPMKAKPFTPSYGISGNYMTDEVYMEDDGTVYRCLQDNTVYRAIEYADAWEKVEW